MRTIHTPQVTDNILKTIQVAPDKVDAVGDESANLLDRMSSSAGLAKTKLPADVVSHGMNTIVGEIIKITELAQVAKFDKDQRYQAYSWAMSNFLDRSLKKGNITEQDLKNLGDQAMQTPEGAQVAQQMREE